MAKSVNQSGFAFFEVNEAVASQLHVMPDWLSKQCKDYESTMKFGYTQRIQKPKQSQPLGSHLLPLASATCQLSMSLFEGLDPNRRPTPDSS